MKADIERTTITKLIEVEDEQIVLTLTKQEAQHLRAISGVITGGSSSNKDSIRYTTDRLYEALESVGIRQNYSIKDRQIKKLELQDWKY